MHNRIVQIVLAILILAPAAAFGQSPPEESRWFLTPTAALAIDGDADPSLAIAGALAYTFTPRVALEGELGHVFDLAPGDEDVDSSLTTLHASLLYFFNTDYRVTLYGAAGLGIGKYSLDVGQREDEEIGSTEIGFNLGAGVTYPLSSSAWLRGDFRFFKHIDNLPSVWRFAGGVSLRLPQ